MDPRAPADSVLAFGAYRLDPVRRILERGGAPVLMPPRALDALVMLAENAGRVVAKSEMIAALWPGRTVEDGSLSQLIFVLRKALADLDPGERFIATAPGRGYRFAAPVSRGPAASAAAPDARLIPTGRGRRFWFLAACGLLALAVVVVGTLLWRSAGGLPAGRRGVVLADFDNATPDPVFDHVLAKALEVDLQQSPFLDVLSRNRVEDTLALMTRPRDQALTPELAAQVCARNQGGAVISGAVAAVGAHYLVSLTATDCLSGRLLAAAKAEAADKEGAPRALDAAARRIRRSLGEALGSIRNFDVPLQATRTASFEALRAYSDGAWLFNKGKRAEALPLFQHAVDLDPAFATAWAALAIDLDNLRQADAARPAISRAYALRDTVGEREKLHITALYHLMVTHDVDASIRVLQLWTTIYPRDAAAWANLSNQQNWIGRYDEAVESGRRAVALDPRSEANPAVLMRALTHAGRLDEAMAVGRAAVAAGVAGDDVRAQIADVAYAQDDRAEVQRQMDWARGKPAERRMLVTAGLIAFSDGRVAEALSLVERMNALGREQGLPDPTAAGRARILAALGLDRLARATIAALPADWDSVDYRYDLAQFGDARRAAALLARDLARGPSDTLLNGDFAPSVRAALLLREGKAASAVAALAPTRTYAMREFDLPYQLGYALLAAGDPAGAAARFREILDNPGRSPTSPIRPLARLGLARALRAAGDTSGARREYAAFLDRWRQADPDLPVLVQARTEAAALR